MRKMKGVHPLFDTLITALPLFESMPKPMVLYRLVTQTPYVSSLVNQSSHEKLMETADAQGAIVLPFPQFEGATLVGY